MDLDLNETEKAKYIFILIVSVYFTTRVIKVNIGLLSGLVLGALMIKFLMEQKNSNLFEFNNKLEIKLQEINSGMDYKAKYLYIDADIINLLYNIIEYKDFNKKVYKSLLKNVDKFLTIRENIKNVVNCNDYIKNAEDFYRISLNEMQSFVYSLPSDPIINEKMKRSLNRLHLLLKRNMDYIYKSCGLSTLSVPKGSNIYDNPLFEIY